MEETTKHAAWSSYLDPSHSKLGQGSAHLGGGCVQVLSTGDHFHKQRIVVGRDDGALEGRSAVQTDSHAFATTEDL